ncbi:hypothetical protein M758_2G026300 [Ceratodon purpureus]|nr:hypothetical protein M758_2G026300 [Ceratodon purpureus]
MLNRETNSFSEMPQLRIDSKFQPTIFPEIDASTNETQQQRTIRQSSHQAINKLQSKHCKPKQSLNSQHFRKKISQTRCSSNPRIREKATRNPKQCSFQPREDNRRLPKTQITLQIPPSEAPFTVKENSPSQQYSKTQHKNANHCKPLQTLHPIFQNSQTVSG